MPCSWVWLMHVFPARNGVPFSTRGWHLSPALITGQTFYCGGSCLPKACIVVVVSIPCIWHSQGVPGGWRRLKFSQPGPSSSSPRRFAAHFKMTHDFPNLFQVESRQFYSLAVGSLLNLVIQSISSTSHTCCNSRF